MSKGISTEVLFDYMALEYGLTISRPLTNVSYDRVVENGGKMNRVQIKETSYKRDKSYVAHSARRKGKAYEDSIDVLAVYIAPERLWIFLPANEIKGSRMRFTLNGKYSKYINNWSIFNAQKN